MIKLSTARMTAKSNSTSTAIMITLSRRAGQGELNRGCRLQATVERRGERGMNRILAPGPPNTEADHVNI